MPMVKCAVKVSKCDEIALINQLDGFDLDPNIKIGFSGPIDVSKVNSSTIYLERNGAAGRIPLSRLVWDASTTTSSVIPGASCGSRPPTASQ